MNLLCRPAPDAPKRMAGGGCAVGGSGGTAGSTFLGLLLLGLAIGRRRQH